MKTKSAIYTALLIGLLCPLMINCKKEEVKTLPTVTISEMTNITAVTASSGGTITNGGGGTVTERGVCWSITDEPTTKDSKTKNGTGSGIFTSPMTDLASGTSYKIKAYAVNEMGTAYSDLATFTTLALAPVLTTTKSIANSDSIKSGGNITKDGGSPVTARGVCWSTTQNPTIANTKTTNGAGTGIFTSSVTGLLPGKVYYIRAYATNSIGTGYGAQDTTTTKAVLPVITTTAISSVTITTAKSGGNIISNGGTIVTEHGICWGTTQNPTTAGNKIISESPGTGIYTGSLISLTPNITYFVRAYATNVAGTAYGEQITFQTLLYTPYLSATALSAITATSVISGGTITSDWGAAITARGICWGTVQNPTIANSKTTDGSGRGSFTSAITGLTGNTTYYIRAYATNSAGTGYSSQIGFTTLPVIAPVISTTAISELAYSSCTTGGTIINDGGSVVSARGVCWGTSQNPTTAGSKTTDGSGTGTFVSNIADLSTNTMYYVRAYATNSTGTTYGDERIVILYPNVTGLTVTDVDANIYHTVKIGTQLWMVENLKTTKYNDGTAIPNASTNAAWSSLATPGYSWYNNNIANRTNYGGLYNWFAINTGKLCPTGWHVPTDAEWTILTDYLANKGYGYQGTGSNIAKSMAATSGWNPSSTLGNVGNDLESNNNSLFTVLPGGDRNGDGTFAKMGNYGVFWSSSEQDATSAMFRSLFYGSARVERGSGLFKANGLSVRCIKD